MQKRSVLYIGNKLSGKGKTVSTIDTLSLLLEGEGFVVLTASSKKNKLFRFFDMVLTTLRYSPRVSYVLIDTYSTQNFYFAVAVSKLCRILKIPYVPILHGGNLPSRLKESPKLSKKLFKGAKTNVTPSRYLLEEFKAKGYHNLTHIPNSIQIDKYPFLLRKEISPKLLWVRSFTEIYNPLLAIETLKGLIERGIMASLTMVGPEKDGSLEKCRFEVEKYNLPVIFTGKLKKEEWIALSKSSDIFINTTNFDNMPVSLIEAAALGLPIISTNVGGIPYMFNHDETAILIQPNDANAFVVAIQDLLTNPSNAEAISLKARKKVEEFDWKNVKHKWLALMS